MQADTLTQIILPLSLFIIMLGMGLSLQPADFSRVIQEPKAFGIGVACQMLLLPLVGATVAFLFALPPELAVGLMILSFCPGGTTSNLFAFLARGDVALSISLTAVVSLITPFSIPLLTVLSMRAAGVDPQAFELPLGKTVIQLAVITLVPVALGMALRHRWPLPAARVVRPMKIFSILFLFAIIAAIIAKNAQQMLGFFIQAGAATLVLNLAAMSLGYLVAQSGRLRRRESVTVAIEVGIQNGTLALLVTGTLLQSATMTIPAVTYSLLMFVTGGLFAYLLQGRIARTTVLE